MTLKHWTCKVRRSTVQSCYEIQLNKIICFFLDELTASYLKNKVSSRIERNDRWPLSPKDSTTGALNRGTQLSVATLVTDSKSQNPSSYSLLIVTISLYSWVSDIFACDTHRLTYNAYCYYRDLVGPVKLQIRVEIQYTVVNSELPVSQWFVSKKRQIITIRKVQRH